MEGTLATFCKTCHDNLIFVIDEGATTTIGTLKCYDNSKDNALSPKCAIISFVSTQTVSKVT